MEKKIFNEKTKEFDVTDLNKVLNMGYYIMAQQMYGEREVRKLKYSESTRITVNRLWESHHLWVENAEGKKYYLARNLWANNIREEFKNVVSDYIDSCHRQNINFEREEIERFFRENNHMNLTDEEVRYVWELEE